MPVNTSKSPKLTVPRLKVTREEGAELILQATNVDLVTWDRTRAKHKWPKTEDAPFLWLTFIGWSAARRTGAIPSELTYEAWEASTLNIEAVDADGNPLEDTDEDAVVDPTPLGPAPASSAK